ncbi:MAG: fimbrillin family protein [Parabacteroides sp.]|nr:fimbrillin family protein [Parabacteroides sp.]
MKTRFFLVGMMAAALLSGCSQDEVVESLDMNQAIGFGTYVGTQTKASEQTIETIKGENKGFGVYAYYTNENSYNSSTPVLNFMVNVHVTFNNSAWEYSPLRYWMNGTDKISFFAYAPYDDNKTYDDENITAKPTVNTTGDPVISFEVNETVRDQTDLLYAKNMNQTRADEEVEFTFNHALSRIAVYAKTSADYYSDSDVEIEVTGITLTGKPNTTGTLNLHTEEWTATPASEDVTYVIGLNSNILSTSEQQLNTTNDYLMIIPTDMRATGFTVTVNYNITQAGVSSSNTVTGTIKDEFIKGTAYKVVLNVGLDAIEFDVTSVEGWNEPEIEIPSTL